MNKFIKVLLFCLLFITIIMPVSADTAIRPPHIDIEVSNAPEELYYLDLLVDDGETLLFKDLRSSKYSFDEAMIKTLEGMVPEGMHSILWGGSHQRTTGTLIGEKQKNGSMLHVIDGYGVPERFRVMFVSKNGETKMSDWYDYEMYIGKIFIDYESLDIHTRPFELFYVFHYFLLVIPFLLAKMLVYYKGNILSSRMKTILFGIVCMLEILAVTPIMSYATIYNGSLGQAAMVLMFGEMVYTFIEYMYLGYVEKVATLKCAAISFGANMLASVMLILILQYEFIIFVI